MTNAEIRNAVAELKTLESMIAELNASATAIKDSIKSEMRGRETEVLNLGDMVIRNTTVTSSRFDTTLFKKHEPDLYQIFLKEVISHKFSIA